MSGIEEAYSLVKRKLYLFFLPNRLRVLMKQKNLLLLLQGLILKEELPQFRNFVVGPMKNFFSKN